MIFSASPPRTKISQSVLWGSVVLILALLTYANSLQNGFVWDDEPIIVKNLQNRDPGAIFQIVQRIDTSRDTARNPYYRPLARLTYWVEYQIHGLNPALCHLANIVLHAVNALLVYRLGLLLFALEFPAVIAALLFAVHPVNCEAVNFLSTRNTLLSTLFVLAAIIVFVRGLEGNHRRAAIWTGLFFFAGALCKESTLFLIPLLPVTAVALSHKPPRESLYRSVPALAACAIGAGVYLFLRQQALNNAGVTLDILPGLSERLSELFYLIPCSFLPIVWPVVLSPIYRLPVSIGPLIPLLMVAWAGVIALFIWVIGRGRCAASIVGLCWYVVFYLPVSGVIPIPSAPMAERYLYLPAIGIWIIAAEALRRISLRFPARTRLVAASAMLCIALLGIRTVVRNLDWQSNYTLFSSLVKNSPQLPFGHHNLGIAYLDDQKDLPKAQAEFEKALALDPNYPRTHTALGYIQMQRRDPVQADFHLTQAITMDPDDAEAHFNRAIVLEQLGRPDDAIRHLERFLTIDNPEFAAARAEAESRLVALKRQTGQR